MPKTLPEKLKTRLEKQFGPSSAREIERAFGYSRLPTFRVNTLKATDDEVMKRLRDEAIAFERAKGIPHAFKTKNRTARELLKHDLATSGKIYLQGLASMLPPLLLDPQPDETVLDLCAAPGSKMSQMAAMMSGSGRLVALENDEIRYKKLLNTLAIQGAQFVEAKLADATLLHQEMPEAFDKVLADVPCSAEGRIDLNDPRSFGYWSEKNIVADAKLQRRLLRSAVDCLKPGGTLVYSTCTLAPEENELMIGWLLAEFPAMKSVEITLPLNHVRQTANQTLTILPNEEMEGFFVAKLQKG